MSNIMLGSLSVPNFVNSRRAVADMGGTGSGLTTSTNYITPLTVENRLTAFDPITYSAANLRTMNYNDKIFALRSIDDPTTISNYHPAQVARTS